MARRDGSLIIRRTFVRRLMPIRLRGNQQIQFVRGNVQVQRTEYIKDINLAELINQRPQTSIEEGGEFKFAQNRRIRQTSRRRSQCANHNNNLGDLVASVSLQLNGQVKNPVVEGRITATRGTLNFRNNPYEITRGLIYLPARLGADPILNIEGQAVRPWLSRNGFAGRPPFIRRRMSVQSPRCHEG